MPSSRCIFGCPTSEPKVPLHKFLSQTRYPERCKEWVKIISIHLNTPDDCNFYRNKFVCDRHFTEQVRNRNNRLNALAVPSLFLSGKLAQTMTIETKTDIAMDGPLLQATSLTDSLKVQQNVPLHRFPNPKKRPELFDAWVSAVGDKLQESDPMKIHKTKKICDYHFDTAQKVGGNRLLCSATPTVHLKRVWQSIASIVEAEHSYCEPQRGATQFQSPTHTQTHTEEKIGETSKEDNKIDKYTRDKDTTVAIDEPCDGAADDCDDDGAPNTHMPECDRLPQELFSWEKTDAIIADDTEVGSDVEDPELALALGDVSMYNDEQSTKDYNSGGECTEYRCNECGEIIKGFRYTCVQCADWDLCAACEARARHAAHYALRVPPQRPCKEIQALLAAIRHQLLSENMFLPEIIASIKEEVKDEEVEAAERAPELEPDPLGAWDGSEHDDDIDILEEYLEQSDEDGHPPRKRRRTSLGPFAITQHFSPHDDSSYNNLVTVTDDDYIETNEDCALIDDGQTCYSKLDYPEPIKIIDIDNLTKTPDQREQNYESYVTQNPNENLIRTSIGRCLTIGDDILDTRKPKLQETINRQKLYGMCRLQTPLEIYQNTSQTNNKTHSEQIGTHRKEISAHSTIIGTGTLSKTKIGMQSTGTGTYRQGAGTRSIANTGDNTNKFYKIWLPPGAHWEQLLGAMLKSKVTVQLEDVMRKKKMHKMIGINEI